MNRITIDGMAGISEVGISLRKLREAAGLTKDELAAKLNTTKSTVSRTGESPGSMSVKFVRKYAQALGKKVYLEIV